MNKFNKKRKGFTLAEILIVVALLGILMTVLLVSVGSYFDKTRETGVRNDFNSMKTAIEVVMRENSGLPKKSGASSGDKTADAAAGFNKTVNLINDYLDPNMKWVDAVDEDVTTGEGGAKTYNGYVVVAAQEGKEPEFTGLTEDGESLTLNSGAAADSGNYFNKGMKYIVSTKTDPWKYNYSVYFQRINKPATVGRLDKVLITSWGSDGNEKEAQYAMLVEYDNGVITVAQAGFQGENLNTLKVGVITDNTKVNTVTRDNAVGTGYDSTTQNKVYADKPEQNLIYGSIIAPNVIIAGAGKADINNFGNADLTQFDADAFGSDSIDFATTTAASGG